MWEANQRAWEVGLMSPSLLIRLISQLRLNIRSLTKSRPAGQFIRYELVPETIMLPGQYPMNYLNILTTKQQLTIVLLFGDLQETLLENYGIVISRHISSVIWDELLLHVFYRQVNFARDVYISCGKRLIKYRVPNAWLSIWYSRWSQKPTQSHGALLLLNPLDFFAS